MEVSMESWPKSVDGGSTEIINGELTNFQWELVEITDGESMSKIVDGNRPKSSMGNSTEISNDRCKNWCKPSMNRVNDVFMANG
jgi:hypothetical protein